MLKLGCTPLHVTLQACGGCSWGVHSCTRCVHPWFSTASMPCRSCVQARATCTCKGCLHTCPSLHTTHNAPTMRIFSDLPATWQSAASAKGWGVHPCSLSPSYLAVSSRSARLGCTPLPPIKSLHLPGSQLKKCKAGVYTPAPSRAYQINRLYLGTRLAGTVHALH